MKTKDINSWIKRKNEQIRRLQEENYIPFTERAEVQQLFGMIIKNRQLKNGGQFYTYEEIREEFEKKRENNEEAFAEPLTREEYNSQVEKFIETYGDFSYRTEKSRWYENFKNFYDDYRKRWHNGETDHFKYYSQRDAKLLYEKAKEMARAWRDGEGYLEFSYETLKSIMGGAYDPKEPHSPPAFMEFLDKLIEMDQGESGKW